jgi:hypothetical protein
VLACFWFFPLLTGDQIGQSYTNYAHFPYNHSIPSDPLPQRSMAPDAAWAFSPWMSVARAQVREGALPLWNRYEYGGTTLLGNLQSALFFPLTWLLLALPLGYAFGVVALLKLVVAGLGAYGLARELYCERRGALLSGTVYMLSAPIVAWVQWPHTSVFGLFPWLLLALTRLHRRRSRSAVAGVGLAVGLMILAGHPESALLGFSAATLFFIGLLTFSAWRPRALLLCAGGFALGLALSAVETIPFLEALRDSVTQEGFFHVTELPVSRALAFGLPQLFGDGEPTLYGMSYFNEDIALYFGLPALVLSAAAARDWLRPRMVALALMCPFALAAMFGIPPVSWLFEHVKPWSTTTLGARIGFVLALVGAVGCGLGFSRLLERRPSVRDTAVIAGSVMLLFGVGYLLAIRSDALAAPAGVRRDALVTGVVALLGCGLLVFAVGRLRPPIAFLLATAAVLLSLHGLRDFNVFLPPDQAYPAEPAALKALAGQDGRVAVLPRAKPPTSVPPNVLAASGLATAEGYDFPLSQRWSNFQADVLGYRALRPEYAHATEPLTERNLAGLRLFNTRFYLAAPGTEAPFRGFEVFYDGPDARIFRDRAALPRAFVVDSVRRTSDAGALAAVQSRDFDPRREAIVPEASRILGPPGGPERSVAVTQVSGDHVRVSLGRGGPGWLVLADSYAPTWNARVDGDEVDPKPTDYAAMGVPVSRSTRTVDFYLDRTSFWVGAVISLLALCAIGLLATWSRLTFSHSVPASGSLPR